jgi:hypothetical protein
VPSFCRHGRLEATCPVCARQAKAAAAPSRPARRPAAAGRKAPSPPSVAARRRAPRGAGELTVRRLARAADDGYDHELVPGLRATADAAALADELAFSVARLEELGADPPGLYAELAAAAGPSAAAAAGPSAAAGGREEALWLAFLIAYLSPLEDGDPWAGIAAARVPWAAGEVPDLSAVPLGPRTAHDPARGDRTLRAYRAWAARAGSQEAAFTIDASWTAERRFDRAFERLALPGLGRTPRRELLTILRYTGLVDVRATTLQIPVDQLDAPVAAAKRIFGIGEPRELRHRVARFADELDVAFEALDLAFANWARPPSEPRITAGARTGGDAERAALLRDALGA